MDTITARKFTQMMVMGANDLEREKKSVDELNVFPVPDGDTGTNMSLTVTSAVKEVLTCQSHCTGDVVHAASSGALRGARGNSGVIVSQLFRGMYKSVKGKETVSASDFAAAMTKGVSTAYKAVMKPKEGTILTVAREAASAAEKAASETSDVTLVMEKALEAAQTALEGTPDLLPVLKEAGVVDSGGKGLTLIYTGFLEALKRQDDDIDDVIAFSEGKEADKAQEVPEAQYCVESVVHTSGSDFAVTASDDLSRQLADLGEAVIVLPSSSDIKVHVHTRKPGEVLEKLTCLGALTSCKVENMSVSHVHVLNLQSEVKKAEPRKQIGFITIAAGDGLARLFRELGVDHVISGGQTMNPSTEDILEAASEVNADHIVVLPNNKNIILAAQQAAKLVKDKHLHVVPTRSIPQGIAAMIGYMPGEDIQTILDQMEESLKSVTSGSVTYAIRDTHMGDFDIKQGDYLALKNGDINDVGTDLMQTTNHLADEMITDETGIFTIYYGKDSTSAQAEELRAHVLDKYPSVEVEIQEGDQPVYYFLLSAE